MGKSAIDPHPSATSAAPSAEEQSAMWYVYPNNTTLIREFLSISIACRITFLSWHVSVAWLIVKKSFGINQNKA